MRIKRLIGMGVLFLCVSAAHAQNCPAGIPSAGNPLCIPPDQENSPYYQGNESYSGTQDQKPSSSFESSLPITWGAIAVDTAKQVAGFSKDIESFRQAKKEALKDCKTKGGSGCAIAAMYLKCVGMAVGENAKFAVAEAETKGKALYFAMEGCKSQGVKCQIYYAACTSP